MADKKVDFEKALKELETTVAKLESGDCTLDESIKLFENGMKNINDCRSALKEAEVKITALSRLESETEIDD